MKVFGKNPGKEEQPLYARSDRYENGFFTNLSETRMMGEEASFINFTKGILGRSPYLKPSGLIPSSKSEITTGLSNLPVITWFGHSSYHIAIENKNILVDPVFSGGASPVKGFVKAFKGADVYIVADMPPIDLLILTHDHYDHLDYKTIVALRSRVSAVVCSLGVKSHLVYWGFNPQVITELDWWESHEFSNMKITATPARHFSGRGVQRARTFWSSFVLESRDHRLFLGGDSGYDDFFKVIGEKFNGFDIALLECGQYNKMWPYIHMQPQQTVQAASDLKAKVLMPVHYAKFALAFHAWNEPPMRVTEESSKKGLQITTPMIGEKIIVGDHYPNSRWFEKP
ncbi:MAG: MBL fold metallo-hydrolase [Flavobacteriales bacterium]|jgi:L-ascorbate metabolism protein UlaG (beta-lactamase superfamily)